MKKALVLAIALVMGLGIAAFAASPLSGSWTSTVTLGIQTNGNVTVSKFSSKLIVDYTVGGWTFESTTKFALAGWTTQEFTANGTLGAFTFSSDLGFNPVGPSFTYWDSTGKVSIAGVDLSSEFLLTGTGYTRHGITDPTGSGWKFAASGVTGDLTLGASAYFNSYDDAYGTLHVQTPGYCFCFNKVEFTASFPFGCIEEVDATLDFSQSGFDGLTFDVSNIAIPNLSWLTFKAELTFETASKSLTLKPSLNLGKYSCITLYADLLNSTTPGYTFNGIEFYALEMSQTWGGVTFTDISVFNVEKYQSLVDPYWPSAYWELFKIESTSDSCCGGNVDFSISTYFQDSGTTLFDWGETEASLSFGIGSNFTITSGLTVNTSGLTKVSAGFTVTW